MVAAYATSRPLHTRPIRRPRACARIAASQPEYAMAATAAVTERRPNRLRWVIRGAAACLLALPLVAMQFTREVQWTGIDFAVMGTLLAIACGAYELGAWLSGDRIYRAAFGLAVLTGFLLMWVTLAVGIIGAENDEANVLFLGVLATGAIGAVLARFRVCDDARVPVGPRPVVSDFRMVQRITRDGTRTMNEDVPALLSAPGFQWNPVLKTWYFVIDTRRLPGKSVYVFRITLTDGSTIPFRFAVR